MYGRGRLRAATDGEEGRGGGGATLVKSRRAGGMQGREEGEKGKPSIRRR